ncbi:hypothetical protein PRZ48_008510 [Zasmidium cellare]|uniref:Vacuolar import and degradation protein 21 n=1 Tax=Zasmidium cellare TaxID=395010 RepID=A0ABR0EGD5_ZASCE|nr:hypothetical protein PRZ48_008510 [Zasmidium cellare]
MSLVDGLRRDASTKRDHELKSLSSSHRGLLRGLWSVNNLIHNNLNLTSLINHPRDSDDIGDDEALFLKKNDLSSGLLFDPASLPPLPTTTTPQHVDASIYASKPSSNSTELTQQVEQSKNVDATAEDGVAAAVAAQLDPNGTVSTVASQNKAPNAILDDAKATQSVSATQNAADQPDGPDVPPVEVAPPLPEDEADLTASEQQYVVDQQEPSRPAKVVHLPPEDVQEAKLRQREAEEERRRQSDAESKSSQHLTAPQTEIASSPSSTVGPYSAATPVPPQDSPDTSPDSESAQVEVLPPKEVRPSPEEQRQKEEHDRLLEAQKEIAKREALGDVDQTPDEQLQWEAREAAAREAEEQAAREEVGGPEPTSKDGRDSTEAEQVVESMQVDDESQAQVDPTPAQDEKHVKTPAIEEEGASKQEEKTTDGDNVDVAIRRSRTPHPINTDVRTESPAEPSTASARPERMTTRVSSGVLRQKSVSEILGQSQSPPTDQFDSSKAAMSPEPISPLTQRHPNDNANITQATPVHAARQTPRSLQQHRLSTVSRPSLEQLDTLKGAADDPNKDYLEPLFRIQAHEAPNSNTKTLPELIRTGTKALSTDDHFTALHERLDFRMLRRIYQLQNANKWSLRQMEKCREPEQPVTLHDHMMAEMKWMRKDFKAERKLKKNVCAFLAEKCAEWVAASPDERILLQVKVKAPQPHGTEDAADAVPELEQAGDSAAEDEAPRTPRDTSPLPATVVIAPELADIVQELRKSGKLPRAVTTLPIVGLREVQDPKPTRTPVTLVSKFIDGKVLPKSVAPTLKRSRFQYEDEEEALEAEPDSKRLREEQLLAPENVECALFQDESKPIRERLHSNNAFRPPSEFIMPSTQFYEFRNGSQWIQEDDQKLRKLAKEYSFNWSLIADEMALPTCFKSSAERRTPWECFERWVDLESLPADMRKTVYFKTWFQRLEQSQNAAERRYLQQIAHLQQAAAASGAPAHVPPRRRTLPTRVEKRKSSRYLWMIDGFRKLAKKREQQQWKQAETARAAAQRKSQTETNPVKMVKMTPQEFSKKRQERDDQMKAAQQQYLLKQREAHQRQMAIARGQAQPGGMPNGAQPQQRPPGANQPGQQPQMQQPQANGQAQNVNGQAPAQPQVRQTVAVAPQRNGHLAPPQVNGQGMPQAPMQARQGMPQQNMQQMAQANAQGRNGQFPNQQQYPMPNGNMPSPGGNMTTAQQLQQNQALLAAFHQQQSGNNQGQNMNQNGSNQQMSASPSMPPPPTPHGGNPQQLSSGHVPQIIAITNQLRVSNPGLSEDQLKAMATQQMKAQSQSSSQTRQSAMNAAAGIPNQSQMQQQQQYAHNQNAYQRNGQMPNGMNGTYVNGDGNNQQANMSPVNNNSSPSQQQQQVYAQKLWQRQQLQLQQMQMQSPNAQHAQLNGSPSVSHASPSMTPASPSMQYSNMNQMGGMGTPMAAGMNGQRPPSRSNTPQMQRLGSSGSGVPTMGSGGMQSPGSQMQGSSPRNMQASMAR